MNRNDYETARNEMVDRQVVARGVRDRLVVKAMRIVSRELFVPTNQREFAYDDMPLPIGHGQTISQPYIVAYMLECLQLSGNERVLEIGTGCGYAAAVLSHVAAEVFTVERVKRLFQLATAALAAQNILNVQVHHADGTLGWVEQAPFDGILVSAGGPQVPESLKSQLKIGGKMVIPVGSAKSQKLVRITRESETKFNTRDMANVRFVPLIGTEGWSPKKKKQ